jgi:hypothetical protein
LVGGAAVEKDSFMDFSQVLIGWVVFSVPASLLIGAFISLGSKVPQQIPVGQPHVRQGGVTFPSTGVVKDYGAMSVSGR